MKITAEIETQKAALGNHAVAVKMAEDTKDVYRQEKTAREELQARVSGLETQISQRKEPPVNGFDKDKYYQLLQNDPLAAANYVDQSRFQVSDPVAYISEINEKVTRFEGQAVTAGFLANHQEFPQGEESAKAMTQRMIQLRNQGHPFGVDTMELAWNQLQQEGAIKPVETQVETQEETMPPSPGGTGGVISEAEMKKAESMTDAELQTYLKSKGML